MHVTHFTDPSWHAEQEDFTAQGATPAPAQGLERRFFK